jgi:hypothetical protein
MVVAVAKGVQAQVVQLAASVKPIILHGLDGEKLKAELR